MGCSVNADAAASSGSGKQAMQVALGMQSTLAVHCRQLQLLLLAHLLDEFQVVERLLGQHLLPVIRQAGQAAGLERRRHRAVAAARTDMHAPRHAPSATLAHLGSTLMGLMGLPVKRLGPCKTGRRPQRNSEQVDARIVAPDTHDCSWVRLQPPSRSPCGACLPACLLSCSPSLARCRTMILRFRSTLEQSGRPPMLGFPHASLACLGGVAPSSPPRNRPDAAFFHH